MSIARKILRNTWRSSRQVREAKSKQTLAVTIAAHNPKAASPRALVVPLRAP